MDDATFEGDVPERELTAVEQALAELGRRPLPGGVATRLDARLAAEVDVSPLAQRRARRRPGRLGSALGGVAALAAAAAIAFALSTGGGHHTPGQSEALVPSTAPTADSAAKVAAGTAAPKVMSSALAKPCPPASRRGGSRPTAACPGARGGHARAV